MITNYALTLIRWGGTKEIPIRHEWTFPAVFWDEATSATTSKTGTDVSHEARVFVPFAEFPERLPDSFGTCGFLPGDMILKVQKSNLPQTAEPLDEDDPFEPEQPSTPRIQSEYIKQLSNKVGHLYRVKECIRYDFGSPSMHHYELTLK